MIQKIKNLDTAFRSVRRFTVIVVMVCAAVSSYALFIAFQISSASASRIYVLSNGKALEAFSAERKDNVPVEARDHVKMFHQYFFSMDPDEQVIEKNIGKALYLCDATAKMQYRSLKEKGYYASMISGNVSQQIEVDSVSLSVESYPYPFRCYARQTITRPTSVVTRLLITEGVLRNVSRSDNNPHGFLIEKWKTIENRDVNVQAR